MTFTFSYIIDLIHTLLKFFTNHIFLSFLLSECLIQQLLKKNPNANLENHNSSDENTWVLNGITENVCTLSSNNYIMH